jgi:UDP-N-acetylglucosamine 2-epimerase (non-hydrolysing)
MNGTETLRGRSRAKSKVLLVAGARPNYMKIAPIYWAIACGAADDLEAEIVHTGQHYDPSMSDDFFRDLALPPPAVNLEVGSGSHAEQTARVLVGFEAVLQQKRPAVVVVVGDVNSTAACALAAAKMYYPGADPVPRPIVAHVEAGLRSRDRMMPEESNRVVADALSDILFTTCREANANLHAEGVPPQRIHFVGNPMIDSLLARLEAARTCPLLDDLALRGRPFGLCTLHRPSNVDRPSVLAEILAALAEIASDSPVLLPVHPRTRARLESFDLASRLLWLEGPVRRAPARGLVGVTPLSYLEMLSAMMAARFVLTDSGGIQEETTALGVPCVTVRENTERPVTIAEGTNVLAGTTRRGIVEGLAEARRKTAAGAQVPELWDGHAGERIVAVLQSIVGGGARRSSKSVETAETLIAAGVGEQ